MRVGREVARDGGGVEDRWRGGGGVKKGGGYRLLFMSYPGVMSLTAIAIITYCSSRFVMPSESLIPGRYHC